MTTPAGKPMQRLLEDANAGQTDEGRAAALLRGTFVPREPTGLELVRIARGLASGAVRQRRGRLVLRVALVLSCMVVGAATVEAYEFARRMAWSGRSTPSPARETRVPAASRRRAPSPASPAAAATEAPNALDQDESQDRTSTPPAPLPAARRPERSMARAAPHRPELPMAEDRSPVREPTSLLPPPMPSAAPMALPPATRSSSPLPAISDEVRELDRAMGYLRRDHDAVAALATLDHYLARHPHGALHQEARQARVDALLMLGRNQQALAELEAAPFDRGLRSTELLVVRAELRAARDCPLAEQDFTAALARNPDARLMERILYGRGVCRIKLQDTSAASDDVRSYLRHFPGGAHGDWARRWLASQGATEKER